MLLPDPDGWGLCYLDESDPSEIVNFCNSGVAPSAALRMTADEIWSLSSDCVFLEETLFDEGRLPSSSGYAEAVVLSKKAFEALFPTEEVCRTMPIFIRHAYMDNYYPKGNYRLVCRCDVITRDGDWVVSDDSLQRIQDGGLLGFYVEHSSRMGDDDLSPFLRERNFLIDGERLEDGVMLELDLGGQCKVRIQENAFNVSLPEYGLYEDVLRRAWSAFGLDVELLDYPFNKSVSCYRYEDFGVTELPKIVKLARQLWDRELDSTLDLRIRLNWASYFSREHIQFKLPNFFRIPDTDDERESYPPLGRRPYEVLDLPTEVRSELQAELSAGYSELRQHFGRDFDAFEPEMKILAIDEFLDGLSHAKRESGTSNRGPYEDSATRAGRVWQDILTHTANWEWCWVPKVNAIGVVSIKHEYVFMSCRPFVLCVRYGRGLAFGVVELFDRLANLRGLPGGCKPGATRELTRFAKGNE
jgi:hypothetical protein